MSAKDLESSLREGGEKVSQGRIRIDSARALQRLRDFRFADPAHWVLEVLRAATLSGAKHVNVRTDADDVQIDFDGQPFPADAMKHLLEQALNAGQTPDEKRTRLLALGAAGALGVGARFVKIRSGGVAVTLENDKVELEDQPGPGTELHLRKAFGWRVTAAFFRGSPEQRAILERALRFPARLTLNGTPFAERKPTPTRVLAGEGWRMDVSLPTFAPLASSDLTLDVAGVVVARRSPELPGLQLKAWLRADDLRRNASGSDAVDDDPKLEAAIAALQKLSRQLLVEQGQELAKDETWRAAFLKRLLSDDSDRQARAALEKVPLIPGPSGERWTIAELTEAVRENGRLPIAKRAWPKGSYPTPTVLLEGDLSFAKLLPSGRRFDVEELVKQKEVVARNRQRFEAAATEPAVLADRAWVARAPITATAVSGEVGFEANGNGAFVRILHQGRPMESGELTALGPLRLRAVVDWSRPLGDSFFAENGTSKLLGLVLKYVEVAATKAICDALPKPEVLPHALDLLTRLVVLRDSAPAQLPAALFAAPLFPCLGGDDVSLATLQQEPRWRFINARVPVGLLDGSRVLVLSPAQRDILKKLGPRRLDDVTLQLRDEQDVRARLSGPKRAAQVDDVVAKVAVVGEGLRGEVGVPRGAGARLTLTLIKSGLELETTELSPRYHHALAAVDCEDLSPNARWTGATRDGAFKAVIAAVDQAQRRLAAALVEVPRGSWPVGAELFFTAFLRKELPAFDPDALDDVTRAVAQAPLFDGAHGRRSLLQLKDELAHSGHFFVLSPESGRPSVPEGFEVLFEKPSLTAVLGEVLGQAPEDATEALIKLEARRRLAAAPRMNLDFPPGVPFECRVSEGPFTLVAGLREGVGDQAWVQVIIDGRAYALASVPCALPLTVRLEAPTFEPAPSLELTSGQLAELGPLLKLAIEGVVRRALKAADDPNARRVLMLTLARKAEQDLPRLVSEALRARELFPCTDGHTRTFDALAGEALAPQFVVNEMKGVLPNRRPIVVASDALTRLVMTRWPRAEPVDTALFQQASAERQRQAIAPVAEVVSRVASPWRQRVSERGLAGEVVIALGEGVGRLELFLDHKPLCVLEGVLPAPLAGALDSPRLTPKPGFGGVVEDEHLQEVVDALKVAAERLAVQLASAPRKPEWEGALVQLAFHVAASMAWEWKGKKKSRGKKKQKTEPMTHLPSHPLLGAPLLRACDRSELSLNQLIGFQRADGRVETSTEAGRFLAPERRAWWPRPGEHAWAEPLGFTLVDVTPQLQFDESIRKRPRYQEIQSPQAGPWREPVLGPSLEGEVALGDAPDGTLFIEVLHQRMLLERWSSAHPVGGVARVNSEAINPTDDWSAAKRDAAFKALVSGTEAAIERLLVRRLGKGGATDPAWASAAVNWRSGAAGPLAELLPRLELFTAFGGRRVTVGAVMDLARRKGRVPLSRPLTEGEAVDTLVLLDTPATRATLASLSLPIEDVSGELRRAKDLERALTSRRLASLTWKEPALLKVAVSTGPLTGELALALEPGKGGVMLARDGISIQLLEDTWPGVVGVIDVKDLAVNDDWTQAQPTRAQRTLIRAQVELLFANLARLAPTFAEREREMGACWALHFLADSGVEAAQHLDGLTGAAQLLAEAPLFVTVEGERVTLRAVAAEVRTRQRVAVLARNAGVPVGVVSCVLATSWWEAPWLDALEALLGKSKVWRVTALDEWSREVREADPPEGAPELPGLRFLRREVRLLRAGALGPLTPDDLEDVRLHRAGGGTALRYDRKRKLALLDPQHPDIARALQEAQQRPERLWVLIAALFGLVNRELDKVTDAQEAQLLLALAGHLAHNPKLLP